MTISISILIIFLIAATLMFLRKLPAMIALPLMALAIAAMELLAGKLGWNDLAVAVIADGAIRLADPIVISMFGGMLSLLMQKTGVAESFVRRGAELAGDSPWTVALIMLAVIAVLFTTIGGLGAVIMVGTIVLPILASIGVREHVAAGIVLFGISLGGALNANNWAIYKSVLQLDSQIVSSYALLIFFAMAVVAFGFVTLELWRSRAIRLKRKIIQRTSTVVLGIGVVLWLGSRFEGDSIAAVVGLTFRWTVVVAGAVIVLVALRDAVRRHKSTTLPPVQWYAYLIPLVPLVLILVFEVSFIAAFLCGLLYGVLATFRRGMMNVTSRAIIEGSASVIPAIVLMIGIGMLLSAVLGPTKFGPAEYWYRHQVVELSGQSIPAAQTREWPVLADMRPLLEAIVPTSLVTYVLMFTLLGPLALYRGPLNVWGLGYGVGGILLATGLPAGAVMGILMSLGMIQGVSDPTNTANVWVANEVRLDVNTIMWRTLPYSWLVAFLGLVIAGWKFY